MEQAEVFPELKILKNVGIASDLFKPYSGPTLLKSASELPLAICCLENIGF